MLILSALLATAYGVFGSAWYAVGIALPLMALFKASSIILLAAVAALGQSRLLTLGLVLGAAGDIGLALGADTFLAGAIAFMIGQLFYIALFLRAGIGVRAVVTRPARLFAMLALIAAAFASTSALVPHDTPLFVPLAIYTAVLTLMAMSSFTLPAVHWPAMLGAVLFFISDGFVAWNMFHHDPDPTLAYWRNFAGWMVYWAGQAAICFGALGLHKPQNA